MGSKCRKWGLVMDFGVDLEVAATLVVDLRFFGSVEVRFRGNELV